MKTDEKPNDKIDGNSKLNKSNDKITGAKDHHVIDLAYSSHNSFDIIKKFKENPIVNDDSLLSYMSTLHKYGDFEFYLWSDTVSVNKMVVCVHAGDTQSEVVFCSIISGENARDNHFVFKTTNQSLLSKWNKYVDKYSI